MSLEFHVAKTQIFRNSSYINVIWTIFSPRLLLLRVYGGVRTRTVYHELTHKSLCLLLAAFVCKDLNYVCVCVCVCVGNPEPCISR